MRRQFQPSSTALLYYWLQWPILAQKRTHPMIKWACKCRKCVAYNRSKPSNYVRFYMLLAQTWVFQSARSTCNIGVTWHLSRVLWPNRQNTSTCTSLQLEIWVHVPLVGKCILETLRLCDCLKMLTDLVVNTNLQNDWHPITQVPDIDSSPFLPS